MKKIILFSAFLAFGFSVHAQQFTFTIPLNTTRASVSPNLSQATADWSRKISDMNNDFMYYSKNYNKVFRATAYYDSYTDDRFADFYESFSFRYNDNVLKDPIIKGMPAPGPNLDYSRVCRNSSGNYDTVVGN